MKVLYKKELSAMLAALLVTGMGYSVTAAEGDTNSSANGGAVVAEKAAAATLTADDLKKQLDKAGIVAGTADHYPNVQPGNLAIGASSSVKGGFGGAIALGPNAKISDDRGEIGLWGNIAVGDGAEVKNSNMGVQLGAKSRITGSDFSVAVGGNNTISNSYGSAAFGNSASLKDSKLSMAIGTSANVFNAQYSVALGAGSMVTRDNTISFGRSAEDIDKYNAYVKEYNAQMEKEHPGDPNYKLKPMATDGSAVLNRQITGVAEGTALNDVTNVNQVNRITNMDATKGQGVQYDAKDAGHGLKETDFGSVTFAGVTQKVDGKDVNVGTKLSNVNDISINVPVFKQVPGYGPDRLIDDGNAIGYEAHSFQNAGLLPGTSINNNKSKNNNIVVGRTAKSDGVHEGAVVIGDHATALVDKKWSNAPGGNTSRNDTIVIGTNARAYNSGQSITMGTYSGTDNSNWATAVGPDTQVTDSHLGAAFGSGARVTKSQSGISVGYLANVTDSSSGVAVGSRSSVTNSTQSVAIGNYSQVYNKSTNSVALGAFSTVNGESGVISVGHKATDLYPLDPEGKKTYESDLFRRITNVADGKDAHDTATIGQVENGYVAYDKNGNTVDKKSVSFGGVNGSGTELKNVNGITFKGTNNNMILTGTAGEKAQVKNAGNSIVLSTLGEVAAQKRPQTTISDTNDAISIGNSNTVTVDKNSAIYKNNQPDWFNGNVAVGTQVELTNAGESVGLGSSTEVSDSIASTAVGHGSSVKKSTFSAGFGDHSKVESGTFSTAIGAYSEVNNAIGSVALGAHTSVDGQDNVVSVGNAANESYKRIVNMADGTIAKDSHDAVTGGQLYTVQQKADNSVQYDSTDKSSVTFGGGEKGTALKNVNDIVFNVAYKNAYDFDKQGTFSFVDAGVIPGKVLTTGKDNFALGTDAVIGYDTLDGSEQSDKPAPNYNVALGNHASIDGGVSSSVVIGNSASAKNWESNEDGTYPELKKIVAIGQAATADHSNATSIGASASVGGTNGTALGAETEARADNSTAVGGKVMINGDAENSVAIGGDSYSEPNGTGSIQYNKTEVAYGAANSTIVGVGAYSQAKYGTSLGADTQVSGENGLALGAHANVAFNAKNAVAIGANSKATEENVVSVGNAENNLQRKVVNVANGKVEKDSHDAVTGGQLYDVSQKVTDLDSLAVKYDSEDRNTVTFTNGTTLKNVNDIEVNVKGGSRGLVSSGITPGTVYATANGWKEGAAADTASLAIGGGLQNSQTTSATVRGKNSIAIGSGATVDATAQELDAPFNGFDNADGVAIGVGSTVSGIQGTAVGYGATVKENQGTAFGNQSAANGNKATAIGFSAVADADNATALGQGASVGTGADNSIALGAGSVVFNSDLRDTDKNGVVSVGSGSAERRIIHVADGTVAENSKDAVNGGQLYAVDAKVTGLAMNAVQYDGEDKSSVTFQGANGTKLGNVADIALVPYKGHASTFVGSGLVNGVVYDTTANSAWTENGSEKTSSIAIGRGSNVRGTSSLALGTGATVGTGDNSTVIANGTALGSNAKAGGQNGTAVGEEATVAGDNGAAFGYQAKADVDSTAIGTNATAGYNGAGESVAIGKSANAQYAQGAAVGNNTNILADQGTALGYGAQITWNGKNSVALGAGSIANEENVVSVGRAAGQGGNVSNPAITRRIVNVADGQQATDAATVGQLNQKISEATQNSVKWDNGSKNTINGVQLSDGKVTADEGISAGNGNFNVDNSGNVSIGKDDKGDAKVTINSSTGDIKTSGTIYTKDGEVASKTYVDGKISGVTTDVTELKGQVSQNTKDIKNNTDNIAQNQKDIVANKTAIETNTKNIGDVKKYDDKKNGFTDVNNVVDATIANRKTIGDGKLDNGAADLTSGINENYKYIQQNRDAIGQLGTRVNKLGSEVDSVGAISSALAGLHPLSYNPGDARYQLSAAVGTYDGTQALALGGFYNINKDVLLSLGLSSDLNGEHKTAGNLGITFRVGSGTSQAYQPATPGVGNDILQRLAAMDQKISDLEAENEDLKNQVKALKNAQATK